MKKVRYQWILAAALCAAAVAVSIFGHPDTILPTEKNAGQPVAAQTAETDKLEIPSAAPAETTPSAFLEEASAEPSAEPSASASAKPSAEPSEAKPSEAKPSAASEVRPTQSMAAADAKKTVPPVLGKKGTASPVPSKAPVKTAAPSPAPKPAASSVPTAAATEEPKTAVCTLSVRCDTLAARREQLAPEIAELVPVDGVLLQSVSAEMQEGETAFSLLQRVTREKKIHLEFQKTPGTGAAYVEGIGNLYEFDGGPLSGWLYRVDGVFYPESASDHTLSPGDRVEWIYTCDLGRDVGAPALDENS